MPFGPGWILSTARHERVDWAAEKVAREEEFLIPPSYDGFIPHLPVLKIYRWDLKREKEETW